MINDGGGSDDVGCERGSGQGGGDRPLALSAAKVILRAAMRVPLPRRKELVAIGGVRILCI